MSERPNEPDARQQRLDALRSLAHDEPTTPATTEAPPALTPASPPTLRQLAGVSPRRPATTARRRWRRWRAPALVIVAAVVIFGVVIGAILKNSGLRLGPKPPPALASKVVSLSAAGSFSCPSTPAWSPDGKQLAVLAVVGASPNGCFPYSDVTNIQQTSNGETTISGPAPDKFAIVIFDIASGHAARTITLPVPSAKLLCAGYDACATQPTSPTSFVNIQYSRPESLGWSPGGHTIAVFASYNYTPNDYIHFQDRGLLITVPVDGDAAPRSFVALGRMALGYTSHPIGVQNIYSPPRFTWNLTSGVSTYADIQRGQWPLTAPFAAGYRLGVDGALTIDQQAQTGDTTPWRQGVLNVYTAQGLAHPVVRYQASQWLWSPDSRYALPNVDLGVYLNIAGETATPPPDTSGLIPEPIVVPPDAALNQTIWAAIKANSNVGLARNPDGKLLAAWDCAPNGAGRLTIRNVGNGQTVAQANYTYPLTSTSLGCGGALSPITWSPDGARIAVSDEQDAQIIVWQVNVHG
ncbi:MAG TPA: hypothetical protein VIG77_12080 [Ktedonobacterales bacterium]